MSYLVNSMGHVQLNITDLEAMPLDDDRFEPNMITAPKRPENVRAMNVWGEPAPWPGANINFSGPEQRLPEA